MWEYGLPLGDPGKITCSEAGTQHEAAPLLATVHLPPQKGTTSVPKQQIGATEEGVREQVSSSVCFLSTSPKTMTLRIQRGEG